MSERFVATFPPDMILTLEQVSAIADVLSKTERFRSEWVGKSAAHPSGYSKKLVPTDLTDDMTLKFLTESDYNAYRFLAANAETTI